MHSFDLGQVLNALQFVVFASVPLLGAVLGGAMLAGIIKVVTQIDDISISYVGRFAGLSMLLYLSSDAMLREIIQFTARIWGGADFYY